MQEHYQKDKLCANIRTLPEAQQNGQIPCFVLPTHKDELVKYIDEHPKDLFVSKALAQASAKGAAVRTGSELRESVKTYSGPTTVVQKYFANPYLEDNRKTDMRAYVVVLVDPVRLAGVGLIFEYPLLFLFIPAYLNIHHLKFISVTGCMCTVTAGCGWRRCRGRWTSLIPLCTSPTPPAIHPGWR